MKQVIVFPKGSLEPKDKDRLTKADIVYVESDRPHDVVMLQPVAALMQAEDILLSAMKGLDSDGSTPGNCRYDFFKELHRRMQLRAKGEKP